MGVEFIDTDKCFRVDDIVYYPHACTLGTLKYVESVHKKHWIGDESYDSWMAHNGGEYQLGRGGLLTYLWEDRLEARKECDYYMQERFDSELLMGTDVSVVKCAVNGGNCHHAQVKNPGSRSHKLKFLKVLNKLFPYPSDTDKQHCNMNLAVLVFECLKNGYGKGVNEALKYVPIGARNCTACAIVIHRLGNPHCSKLFDLVRSDHACCMGPKAYQKYFKNVSIALRRTSLWHDGTPASLDELTACTYWELPLGRGVMKADFETEYEHRCKSYLPLKMPDQTQATAETDNDYWEYAAPVLDEVLLELVPNGYNWPTWHDHCENRHSWLPSGSAGAKYAEVDGKKVRLNKRAYMEQVPIPEMIAWLDTEPKLMASTSDKFEMGKARSLYPTDVVDQCIVGYVIGGLERRFHNIDGIESGLVGIDEVRTILRRCQKASEEGVECTMLDYADFNIQHTLQAQAKVFERLRDRMMAIGAEPDAVKACEWARVAHLNQYAKYPLHNTHSKSTQGLFSGNRATHFLNTILNLLYFRVAMKWVKENLGMHPIDLMNIHQGDDVWITNKSRLWATCLYNVMKSQNFVFQPGKQIMDQNFAEYLRVVYTKEGAKGYVARTIATLIEKPLQSEVDLSPATKASALNSQIAICYRRGLTREFCKVLWDTVVPFALKIRVEGVGDELVPLYCANRSFSDGGLDLGPPMTMAGKNVPLPPVPVVMLKSKKLAESVQSHTTEAYIRIMSAEIGEAFNADKVRDQIHASNISDSIPQSDKYKALTQHVIDLRNWKDKLKKIMLSKECVRNYEIMDKWVTKKVDNSIFSRKLISIEEYMHVKCDRGFGQFTIQNIIQAIAGSPYKDVATAKQALGLGTIEAAQVAIASCKNKALRMSASGALNVMVSRMGKDVTSRVLAGIRGYGPAVESLLHPIIISVITAYSAEMAIQMGLERGLCKASDWDALLGECQSEALRVALQQTKLPAMSHY